MSEKPILQFRRGTRFVDEKGNTIVNEQGQAIRDDWTAYTQLADHVKPLEGELVVEFEQIYNPLTGELGKVTPRFKIGYGNLEFRDLDYISPDSFTLPNKGYITLSSAGWQPVLDENNEEVEKNFYQIVTVTNATVTKNSMVDFQPTPEQVALLKTCGVTLTPINSNGTVKVYLTGDKLTSDYILQVTVTEVE